MSSRLTSMAVDCTARHSDEKISSPEVETVGMPFEDDKRFDKYFIPKVYDDSIQNTNNEEAVWELEHQGNTFHYTGEFKNGYAHGQGRLEVDWTWNADNKAGELTKKARDLVYNITCEGEFQNGIFEGSGKFLELVQKQSGDDFCELKGTFLKGKIWNGDASFELEGRTHFIRFKITDGRVPAIAEVDFIGPDNFKSEYVGEVNDEFEKHGQGERKEFELTSNGYELILMCSGTWKNDLEEGNGKCILSDGTIYEGEFKAGTFCGEGELQTEDKIFIGKFFDNQIRQGTMYDETTCSNYTGHFQNFLPEGLGREISPPLTIYQGQFHEGRYHGGGVLIVDFPVRLWGDFGSTYRGQFQNGEKSGKGILTWNEGGKYIGTFQHDQMNGMGDLSVGGIRYSGEFVQGQPNGLGKYSYENGCEYEGQVTDDRYTGHGRFKFPDKSSWEGQFDDSKPIGVGLFTSESNSRVESYSIPFPLDRMQLLKESNRQ